MLQRRRRAAAAAAAGCGGAAAAAAASNLKINCSLNVQPATSIVLNSSLRPPPAGFGFFGFLLGPPLSANSTVGDF
jgi:hypothetical protein